MYLNLNDPVVFVQFLEEQQENADEDLDIRALEDGFVSCNSIQLSSKCTIVLHTADLDLPLWNDRLRLLLSVYLQLFNLKSKRQCQIGLLVQYFRKISWHYSI